MKKKLSIVLSLVLLLLPFSILLNVKATGVTISTTTGNLVDNYVTVTIDNVATNDSFQAYKIVDIYYNQSQNQMTYAFTTAFQTFINNSQDAQISSLTIDKYMNLSDDIKGTVIIAGVTQPEVSEILEKYIVYLDANSISGTQLTKTGNTISHSLAAGAYLILPISNGTYSASQYGGVGSRINVYRTLLMNGVFTVDENNDWQLPEQNVTLKDYNIGFEYGINSIAALEMKDILETNGYMAALQYYMNNPQFSIDRTYSMNIYNDDDTNVYNHSAVYGNAAIVDKIKTVEITFSQGIDYDISKIYRLGGSVSDISVEEIDADNGTLYNTDEPPTAQGTYSITGRTVKYKMNYFNTAIIMSISLNSNAVIGSTGNSITYVAYKIKDLHATIDSQITETDIDNAFIYEGTASDTTTYQQIRNVLERIETTATIYTYGIEITNYEANTTTNLPGGEFAVYEYDETNSVCTNNQIGNTFTTTNNKANFIGVDGLTKYCVKQVRTPNGYTLNNTSYIIGPNTSYSTTDQNGNYALTIYNTRTSALPFTGGIGTIIYTVGGLVLISGSIVFIIMYKKKNKQDNNKE